MLVVFTAPVLSFAGSVLLVSVGATSGHTQGLKGVGGKCLQNFFGGAGQPGDDVYATCFE
ncbi:MAG: hypothetical protein JEY79_13740 [Pseudodesulfovibrio sp.]|nr:hypothetical protein [Pseudodesulfovibrio sp.]